mgnify:FL=1
MFRLSKSSIAIKNDRKLLNRINNLDTNVTSQGGRLNTIEKFPDIDNLIHACSTVYSKNVKNATTTIYSGSGSFVSFGAEDLQKGWFMTAAHTIMDDNRTLHQETHIVDPHKNLWHPINNAHIFIDGIADIALIRTDIDMTSTPNYTLKLASAMPNQGDRCFVFGNPLGIDADSISDGIVRDPHFSESGGQQIVDSIYVSSPSLSGNSGSPILNTAGDIIGILTFGAENQESLAGGANIDTMKKVFEVLTAENDNRDKKKYLGMKWIYPSSFYRRTNCYTDVNIHIPNQGAVVDFLHATSPFSSTSTGGHTLAQYDVLLSAVVKGKVIKFGTAQGQVSPGVLCYEYDIDQPIELEIFQKSTQQTMMISFYLNKTYSQQTLNNDTPLIGGVLSESESNTDITNKSVKLL